LVVDIESTAKARWPMHWIRKSERAQAHNRIFVQEKAVKNKKNHQAKRSKEEKTPQA
jgi:hypothetical protein